MLPENSIILVIGGNIENIPALSTAATLQVKSEVVYTPTILCKHNVSLASYRKAEDT